MTFSDFVGNERVVVALRRMVAENRLPQTLLFAGPRGVGKATLARLLAAALNCLTTSGEPCGRCSNCFRILQADLSRDEFQKLFQEREKTPAAQRVDNPLIISTHPDFLVFPPDGPMRLITIEQARRLRDAARFGPSDGRRRVFLIDQADRANEEAANSLLKTLEEPAPSLTLILTAENPYELLPTIRSRAIPFHFALLSEEGMQEFFASRPDMPEGDPKLLAAWSQGSPGRALSLDVEEYGRRRETALALLQTSLGTSSFADLLARTETLARKSQERLDELLDSLLSLLQDLLHIRNGLNHAVINADIHSRLKVLAAKASFDWIEAASARLSELDELQRRNIQKQIALEALALDLRRSLHS